MVRHGQSESDEKVLATLAPRAKYSVCVRPCVSAQLNFYPVKPFFCFSFTWGITQQSLTGQFAPNHNVE